MHFCLLFYVRTRFCNRIDYINFLKPIGRGEEKENREIK